MAGVNPERGEVGIELDGRIYPMRPSYEAILEIESAIGPILAISMRLKDPQQMLKLDEIAVIVCTCIQAAGRDREDPMLAGVKAEKVRKLIYADGMHYAIRPLTALLYNMLTGGGESKKKPDASLDRKQEK